MFSSSGLWVFSPASYHHVGNVIVPVARRQTVSHGGSEKAMAASISNGDP